MCFGDDCKELRAITKKKKSAKVQASTDKCLIDPETERTYKDGLERKECIWKSRYIDITLTTNIFIVMLGGLLTIGFACLLVAWRTCFKNLCCAFDCCRLIFMKLDKDERKVLEKMAKEKKERDHLRELLKGKNTEIEARLDDDTPIAGTTWKALKFHAFGDPKIYKT